MTGYWGFERQLLRPGAAVRELLFRSRDGRFGVHLDAGQVDRLLDWCDRSGAVETGGILIGRYTAAHDCALVTGVLGPPPDSRRGPTWFQRGVAGLQAVLDRVWGQRRDFYVGEWHFHPFAAPLPSRTDYRQMSTIAVTPSWICPEPVLVIVGGDPRREWRASALVVTRQGERVELVEDGGSGSGETTPAELRRRPG
jgi:integrative and conjugative element protein (TIGR02256 family)